MMKGNKHMKIITNIIYPAFALFAVACFALSPSAQAVSPAPDGGYPGFNTAEGQNALLSLTTGAGNTGVGWYSLFANSTNNFNTGVGAGTLVLNTADNNTAVGTGALLLNTTGAEDTAVGSTALLNNSTGNDNTANGAFALTSNTTGGGNTATGHNALASNMTGSQNTANGGGALGANTADNNTAVGRHALFNNTTGAGNTALGHGAGTNQTTGSNNIYIGAGVGGVSGESNACYIASIFGQPVDPASGTAALVDTNGKLGTMLSARRFKHDIKPMDKASEAILALKPVTFHYKSDAKNTPCFGLIAEEVAEVNPDLVVRNKDGDIYTVRYDQVNAMLLNEFLKEHHQVQDLKTIVAGQQKQIQALTAGLQKVSAQLATASPSGGGLEASKPAPQVAENN
jgi:hypothetical protein